MNAIMNILNRRKAIFSLMVLAVMFAPSLALAGSFTSKICVACYFFSPTLIIFIIGSSLLAGSWYALKHMKTYPNNVPIRVFSDKTLIYKEINP